MENHPQTEHRTDKGVGAPVACLNWTNLEGNTAGGFTTGSGFAVAWQNGPLNRKTGEQPTGAFVEDLLMAAYARLDFYQDHPLSNVHNARAQEGIGIALDALAERRRDRNARGVSGTYQE